MGFLAIAACQKTIPTPDEVETTSPTTIGRTAKNPETHFLGYGYEATEAYARESGARYPVLDIARFKADHPDRFFDGPIEDREYREEFGINAQEYAQKISSRTSVGAGVSFFGGNLTSSYSSGTSNRYQYDRKHIYGDYTLYIKKRRLSINATAALLQNYLHPVFLHDVQNLETNEIIAKYGTHVMTDIYAGGKLSLLYQSETTNSDRVNAARAGVNVAADFIFNLQFESAREVETWHADANFNRKLAYRTTSGNASIPFGQGIINLEMSRPQITSAEWQRSVTYGNAELIDFGQTGLISITDLVRGNLNIHYLTPSLNGFFRPGQRYHPASNIYVFNLWTSGLNIHFHNKQISLND